MADSEKINVYDNFVDKKNWSDIYSELTSHTFPWYWGEVLQDQYLSCDQKNNYQFCHYLYVDSPHNVSTYISLIQPLLDKIKPDILISVKANLNPRTAKIIEHGYHVDYEFNKNFMTTGVYYINDNNGYTKFDSGSIIDSVANRYVEFPTYLPHTGSTLSNQQRRIVINFNYVKY